MHISSISQYREHPSDEQRRDRAVAVTNQGETMGYSKKKLHPFLVAVEPQGGVVWGTLSVVWAADLRTARALAVEPFADTDQDVIVVPMIGHEHEED